MACDYAARWDRAVFREQRNPAFVLAARGGVDVAVEPASHVASEPVKEPAVTREDDGREARISNWTLATGTLPGRRNVEAVTAAAVHPTAEKTTS
jgi:hypothetical protein